MYTVKILGIYLNLTGFLFHQTPSTIFTFLILIFALVNLDPSKEMGINAFSPKVLKFCALAFTFIFITYSVYVCLPAVFLLNGELSV